MSAVGTRADETRKSPALRDRPEGDRGRHKAARVAGRNRVAFVLRSRAGLAHLKIFAPALAQHFKDPALSASHEPPLLFVQSGVPPFDRGALWGLGENYDRIERVPFTRDDDLVTALRDNQVGVVLACGPGSRYAAARAASRREGVKWIALPHNHVEVWLTTRDPEDSIEGWDIIAVHTGAASDLIQKFIDDEHPSLSQQAASKLRVVGNLVLDQLLDVDRQQIRRAYELPADKPIVLLAAYDQTINKRAWSRFENRLFESAFLKRKPWNLLARAAAPHLVKSCPASSLLNYQECLRILRQFADNSGAALVMKHKSVHYRKVKQYPVRHPFALEKHYCDYVFEDRCHFPFTTTDLCAVSSAFVGFFSTMALEAVAAGCYALSLHRLDVLEWRRTLNDDRSDYYREPLYDSPGGLFHSTGLSESIRLYTPEGAERFRSVAGMTLDDFKRDDANFNRLNERVLGMAPDPEHTNSRVVWDLIESLL